MPLALVDETTIGRGKSSAKSTRRSTTTIAITPSPTALLCTSVLCAQEIGQVEIKRDSDLIQRFQGRIGLAYFNLANKRLAHVRLVGEGVLRP